MSHEKYCVLSGVAPVVSAQAVARLPGSTLPLTRPLPAVMTRFEPVSAPTFPSQSKSACPSGNGLPLASLVWMTALTAPLYDPPPLATSNQLATFANSGYGLPGLL